MGRKLAIIIALLASLCSAQAIFRVNSVLTLAQSHEIFSCDPHWWWEGNLSRVEFDKTSEGVRLHWSIDINGPYWIFIDLVENHCGVYVNVEHSMTGRMCGGYYADYEGLCQSDDEAGKWVHALLGEVPEVNEQDIPVPPNLLLMLNDESWSARDVATRELRRYKLNLRKLDKSRMSDEQRTRIEYVLR